MRQAGRINNWNDDKGFGFVTPHYGGARAFVHVKAFQVSARRPQGGGLFLTMSRLMQRSV
jgi:cold shock CspA family protein